MCLISYSSDCISRMYKSVWSKAPGAGVLKSVTLSLQTTVKNMLALKNTLVDTWPMVASSTLYLLKIDGMYKQNKQQLVTVNQIVPSRLSGWFSTSYPVKFLPKQQ